MTTEDRTLRVAIAQHDAALHGPDARFAWLDEQARALAGGNDLLVCPEVFVSGYDVGGDLHRYAEAADGDFAGRVSALARETGMAIVYGYPERDGDTVFNSALAIGADGATLANHRKTLLPPGFEADYFAADGGLTLFTVKGVRIAVIICYEAEFPETVRNVAKLGAEVVCVPTALVEQWDQVAQRVIPTRAFENGVYLLYANHAGREGRSAYYGGSCIADPWGRDVARAGPEPVVLTATIDAATVHAAQARLPYLRDCARVPGTVRSDA
ncbi:MAG: carbon-nitrogen hydrolase family protein [Rhodospirillales bacterium]